jgi:hypothetical protein
MKIRRRLEMVIETQTRQVIRAESNSYREAHWCPECAAAVVMITPEGTGIVGATSRAIYRLVESGKVHFAETPEGTLLICLSSLAAVVNQEVTGVLDLEVKTAPRSVGD